MPAHHSEDSGIDSLTSGSYIFIVIFGSLPNVVGITIGRPSILLLRRARPKANVLCKCSILKCVEEDPHAGHGSIIVILLQLYCIIKYMDAKLFK